jgi:hypothetical protein
MSRFFGESFLGFSKMDKKNVQNRKGKKSFPKKPGLETIIEIWRLVTKKIILILLA